jgi:hypothetical protein
MSHLLASNMRSHSSTTTTLLIMLKTT